MHGVPENSTCLPVISALYLPVLTLEDLGDIWLYISDPDGLETMGGKCFTLRQMLQEARCIINNFLSAAFHRGLLPVILRPTELLWTSM